MVAPEKAHARLHLANERTLLSWTKLGSIFAAGGFLTKLAGAHRAEPAASTPQLLLGLLVIGLGLKVYASRRSLLAQKWHGSYTLPIPPWIACISIWTTLAMTFLQAALHEVVIRSPECLQLGPLAQDPAPPPYLYITFHGADNPSEVLCEGTGAVQRFTLDGGYVGPATDQVAAMVHSPRGLVFHNELLVLADAGEGAVRHAPSLAVFGDCAGVAARPFLGRIHSSRLVEPLFVHPYGLAAAPDGTLRATSQDGGALLQVDMSTANITVLEQFEESVDPRGNTKSGPLRGVAVDTSGCSYVADKHAGKVWHACPGKERKSTAVKKPIAMFADLAHLYVGSYADTHPAVIMFSLKLEPGAESLTEIRRFEHPSLVHPAGLVVNNGVLYVLEQEAQALLSFDVASGRFNGVLIKRLPDRPEGLLLAPGC
jgi:uncharacterized membrane protein YidH (DUF202 family)